MRSLRLITGSWIGVKMLAPIEPITIEHARSGGRRSAKVAARLRLERMKFPVGIGIGRCFDHHFHSLGFRGPNPEMGLLRGNHLGPDRQPPFRREFHYALSSPIVSASVAADVQFARSNGPCLPLDAPGDRNNACRVPVPVTVKPVRGILPSFTGSSRSLSAHCWRCQKYNRIWRYL